jgi:hypothetical protein
MSLPSTRDWADKAVSDRQVAFTRRQQYIHLTNPTYVGIRNTVTLLLLTYLVTCSTVVDYLINSIEWLYHDGLLRDLSAMTKCMTNDTFSNLSLSSSSMLRHNAMHTDRAKHH